MLDIRQYGFSVLRTYRAIRLHVSVNYESTRYIFSKWTYVLYSPRVSSIYFDANDVNGTMTFNKLHSSAQVRQDRSDVELWINFRKGQRGLIIFGFTPSMHGPRYILEMYMVISHRNLYSMLGMGDYRYHFTKTDTSSAQFHSFFYICPKYYQL